MSFSQTHKRIVDEAGVQLETDIVATGDGQANVSAAVAVGTNQVVDWAVDVSQIKGVFIQVDGALTIKTNSSGSPDDTLTFAGAGCYEWTEDDLASLLLTTDVTKLYVTNGTSGAVQLEIRCVYDATV